MTEVLESARSEMVRLLGRDVFPNRLQEHTDPSMLSELRSLSSDRTLAIVSHREISSVGDARPSMVAQRMCEALKLQGRIDGPEILHAALTIENALRAGVHRVTGDQAYAEEIPSVRKPERRDLPLREYVCCDMDGVLATLKPVAGATGVIGFRDTLLGQAVQRNAELFEAELLARSGGGEGGADARDTEMGLLPYLTQRYGPMMEEIWLKEAQDRIRQMYIDAYPPEHRDRALREAEAHIVSMPGAYHVFRHKTWDHDLREIYETDSSPRSFAEEVSERGGKLVFITAAPRIHAVKMLAFSGIIDTLGPDGFTLYSVEDMYREGSVANNTFVEGDKGEILRRLQRKTGVARERFVMGGDQVHSDVLPATAVGVDACLISGPADLANYARRIRLPRDSK